MADAISAATAAYDAKINSIAPTAVLIQVGLMSGVSLATLFLFSALRPRHSLVFQPKLKYSHHAAPPPSKDFLGWISPLRTTTQEQLLDTIGLDAVTFLLFLVMCRNVFLCIALVGIVGLLPVDITYNLKLVASSKRNPLSILTIQDVRGSWLWGHVAATYLITFIVLIFVWRNYGEMVRLRKQWFRTDEYKNSMHARSLMITSVPKAYQSDRGLAELLQSLRVPYPTTAVHIGRKVGSLPRLIQQHNDAVRALEAVLTTYFKNPDQLPSKRPTLKVSGKRVDAIDHLSANITLLDSRIEQARSEIGNEAPENYGFIAFSTPEHANIVGKLLEGKRKKSCRFAMAPVPTDIIWENITMSDGARTRSIILGSIVSFVFLVLYTIPLLFVSLLANLAALTTYLGFLDTWSNKQPFLFSAFAGIVPPLLSILLQLLLPIVMRWIATYQGATTHTQLDRIITSRYSAFLFVSQFFIFSLLGVIVQVITKIAIEVGAKKSFGEIVANLSAAIPSLQQTWVVQSTYWLTVFPLRGFAAVSDLAQLLVLVWVWVKTKLFGRTVREIREATKPTEFDYAVYWANHLLMVAVGFVYAPLAPLVPLFAAIAFSASLFVYKYQLMYVCVTKVETGGRLWRVAINRVLFALIGMQALMLLTMGLQKGWINAISMLPPIVIVAIFKIILSRKFDSAFRWYEPTDQETSEATIHHADARKHRLEKRFGHPSLHEDLFTPMLHKNIQHLLPTIYNGRIGHAHGKVDGHRVDGATAGGLTFNLLEARNLTYDRATYLRQRDEDAMSISTGTMLSSAMPSKQQQATGDYFDARRPYGDEGDVSYEQMGGQAYASTEYLIGGQQPPSYAAPPMPAGAGRPNEYAYVQEELASPAQMQTGYYTTPSVTPHAYTGAGGSPRQDRYSSNPPTPSTYSPARTPSGYNYPPAPQAPQTQSHARRMSFSRRDEQDDDDDARREGNRRL